MHLLGLLLSLSTASAYLLVQPNTQLINGRYKLKFTPFEDGKSQYLTMWGIDADTLKLVKENPWTEVYQFNDDGTLTVFYGGEDTDLTYTINEPITYPHPFSGETTTTTSLLAPNVLQHVSVVKESGVTDVTTITFSEHGLQKTAVASKPSLVYGHHVGRAVAPWSSVAERVDAEGAPAPLAHHAYSLLGWHY